MDYHLPGETPRDRMWARLAAARTARRRRRRLGASVLAAAAVLALAFVLGRQDPVAPPAPRSSEFSRLAAARLFERADVLLSTPSAGDAGPRAGALLAQTRILLDCDVADDPATRILLQDLELVLARLATADDAEIHADIKDRLRLAAAGA